MSDISVPGISGGNGMNTSQMIEDLMEVERQPVRRLENRVDEFEAQQEAWRAMGRQLNRLQDAARGLYGFENPFRARIADSSNESVLTADANRQADEAVEELTVLQTAGKDRFASRSIAGDYRVQPGTYEFTVGDESRSVRFSGGNLEDFAETVNERAGNLVDVSVVSDTPDTRVLVIEGRSEGADARLTFGGDASSMMQEIGVMNPPRPDQRISLLQGETLRLEPGQTSREPLDRRFSVQEGMVLRFEARTEQLDEQPWDPPPTPPGPDTPEPGSVTLEGITVQNESLGLDVPEREPPEPPEVVENNRAIRVLGPGDTAQELPALPEASAFQSVEISADRLPGAITGFAFENRNTNRALEIRNIEVFDPAQRGEASPANALETAQDARIRYNGIEITRSSNEIDDLIPGVTLNLRRASDDPVRIDIRPDRETAKDSIIQMVGFYNQVIRDINIYTRTDEAIIEQIDYFDSSERETMQERLGIFQGDSSLNQLRSRMQTIMMNPYDTGPEHSLSLLAEIGISTNASGFGGGFDPAQLRGYLEINESQLDSALETNFEAVSRLFGHDSDGDLAVDEGVAVALERFVTPYVRTGGIVAGRESSIETQIDNTEQRITRYNERLEDYEQELRREFGRMEGLREQLQDSSRALDRLPSPGTGGQ